MKKKTILPGPAAKKWVARDAAVLSPSYTRPYPLVVASAKGATMIDVDGNHFLDMTSGIAVTATGHCHPAVVRAICAQAKRLIHMSGTDFYYPAEILLAEKLAALAPGNAPKKVFLTNSGTEAVEAAMKLARHQTRRPYYLAFLGAFHGRSMGALSLTASKTVHRTGFAPLLSQVIHVPYPNPYRPPNGITPSECAGQSLRWIREVVFRHLVDPEEVAAIFVEPIQGEGGYIIPPPEFLPALADLAREFGIFLVVDEIQTGMGRTGRMFACEHVGVAPDILTVAKGIASGLPLGAMIAGAAQMTWPPGAHGNTFGGNPIACEAARATIDLLEKGLMKNAEKVGRRMLDQLQAMQPRHRLIGDVRGVGLMIGVELVRDRETKEPAIAERNRVIQRCFEAGLLLLGCGQSVIRFAPPLILRPAEADRAVTIFEEALAAVASERTPRS